MPRTATDPDGRNPSMKDVANQAGVSLGTVSNVLNRPEVVSSVTRERVARAMAELGFVRNASARQLRSGRSQTLGYIVLDAANPFFTDVARAIERETDPTGMSLFICNSDQNGPRERKHLERLAEQRVAGVFLTPIDSDEPSLDAIADQGLPLVLIDRTRDDERFCSVAVDDRRGGALAIRHLLDRGHQRVAFVGGPSGLGQVEDRWDGARAAWADAARPTADLTRVETSALTVRSGHDAGQRIAAEAPEQRPTAAFCANDLLALGLLQYAVRTGRRVPADLAIVGYDDIEFAAAAAVPLSSVRQPRRLLGERGAALMLDETSNPRHVHQTVVFEPELIVRDSTIGG